MIETKLSVLKQLISDAEDLLRSESLSVDTEIDIYETNRDNAHSIILECARFKVDGKIEKSYRLVIHI